jgi:acyl-CoA thioester hydrolase
MIDEHEIEIRVRYQETDAMGVLHHANYFTYFEMGRTELLRVNGYDYRRVEEGGTFMVIVDVSCRYRRPARYDDLLRLRTRLQRVTPAKIEHVYQLFRGDDLIAEATSLIACVDREGRLQRVPDWLRESGPGTP